MKNLSIVKIDIIITNKRQKVDQTGEDGTKTILYILKTNKVRGTENFIKSIEIKNYKTNVKQY